MSAIFARGWLPAGSLLALALLAACSSGSPRPAAVPTAISEPRMAAAGSAPDHGGAKGPGAPGSADATDAPAAPVPPEVEGAYLLALDAMAAGDWLEAARRLELLVADNPDLAGPRVNLAIVYRQLGRAAEAEAALANALEISPGHAAANNELGVMARERGDFASAEAAYRRAIAADPDYALAHYNLGVLLDLYLQRGDEALAQYMIYQDLTGEPDPNVDFWVVDLRRRLGLPTEAVRLAQEDAQ